LLPLAHRYVHWQYHKLEQRRFCQCVSANALQDRDAFLFVIPVGNLRLHAIHSPNARTVRHPHSDVVRL
jgi:hypothetical protein